jgi:hypothetical protein
MDNRSTDLNQESKYYQPSPISRRLNHLEEADTEQGEEAGREEMKEEYIKEEEAEKDEEQAGMKREEEELEQQGSRELKWHLHLSEKD